MHKLLVIIGPTSSGKSELAVKLAKLANGEIISCDSRQIYKGMDLGTGKVEGKWSRLSSPSLSAEASAKVDGRGAGGEGFKKAADQNCFIYKNIPHHLIDFVNPKRQYSAALFQRDANKAIADILRRGKLPVLCGGTAHWINAVVFGQQLPDVKPNLKLRRQLEKQSAEALFKKLVKIDPARAKIIDRFNKRRLIRALEIVLMTGKPVPPKGGIPSERSESRGPYDALWIGINPVRTILFAKIKKRLKQRLDQGMTKEVSRLHHQGLSYKHLESFGMEYKFASLYLQKKISYNEMFEQLFTAIKQYAKRQMTWWKRNKKINWINNQRQAFKLVDEFLK